MPALKGQEGTDHGPREEKGREMRREEKQVAAIVDSIAEAKRCQRMIVEENLGFDGER
jgi:hypothetical protein